MNIFPNTNPNSNAYSGPTANDTLQNVPPHIAITNIHEAVPGVMKADILFNYWSGEITTNTTWSNDAYGNPIYVGGDITVLDGVTLTISSGTEVCFAANSDDQGAGYDSTKCELIVEGTLEADGVTFRSDSDSPSNADWQGIRAAWGTVNLVNSTLQHAQNGVWLGSAAPAVLEGVA